MLRLDGGGGGYFQAPLKQSGINPSYNPNLSTGGSGFGDYLLTRAGTAPAGPSIATSQAFDWKSLANIASKFVVTPREKMEHEAQMARNQAASAGDASKFILPALGVGAVVLLIMAMK